MELVSATIEDARAIAEVHVSAWQAAYDGLIPAEYLAAQSVARRESHWRQAITRADCELLLAREDGDVLGWIAFGRCRDPQAVPAQGEVWALYAAPLHWSRGIGRALWLEARRRLASQGFASVSLWVLADNLRAIRFYSAAGFFPDPSGVKEIVMSGKPLKELRYVASLIPQL